MRDTWNMTPDEARKYILQMTKVLNIPIEGAWHYPSKGEYPTENGEYWVAWRSPRTGQLMYGVGLWEIDRFLLNPQPKAWQYIVPPKEEA